MTDDWRDLVAWYLRRPGTKLPARPNVEEWRS